MATLYIIPNVLYPGSFTQSLPAYNSTVVKKLKHFFVETPKAARQLLKKSGAPTPFDDIHFYELKQKISYNELRGFIQPLITGEDMGLISDAGYPSIADPGEQVIAMAHQLGIAVKPLTGPSSIFLALVSSGLNAEQFTFHGYLPIAQNQRIKRIRELEKMMKTTSYTQVFMETPYRNRALLASLLNNLNNGTLISISSNITADNENIKTMTVAQWKKHKINIDKQPAIFMIGYYV